MLIYTGYGYNKGVRINMSNIWFTSNTMFGRYAVVDKEKRPFSNGTEATKVMIENWNSQVDKDDLVYHLGDFGDFEYRKLLNGKIILIKGESDDNYIKTHNYRDNEIFAKSIGFESVYNHLFVSTSFGIIKLMHRPSQSQGTTTITDDKVVKCFNLFGHIYKTQMVKRFIDPEDGTYFYGLNVGVDCHNFKLLSLKDIEFYKTKCNVDYDEVFY